MSRRTEPRNTDRELAEQLRVAIGRLVRATRAQTDALPRARAELLGQLDRDGPQTIAELAAGRGVRHQAMSRSVKEVEALELIERGPDPSDGRAQLIRITATGAAAIARDRAAHRDLLATAIRERLDDSDRQVLQQVPRLLETLTDATRPPDPLS